MSAWFLSELAVTTVFRTYMPNTLLTFSWNSTLSHTAPTLLISSKYMQTQPHPDGPLQNRYGKVLKPRSECLNPWFQTIQAHPSGSPESGTRARKAFEFAEACSGWCDSVGLKRSNDSSTSWLLPNLVRWCPGFRRSLWYSVGLSSLLWVYQYRLVGPQNKRLPAWTEHPLRGCEHYASSELSLESEAFSSALLSPARAASLTIILVESWSSNLLTRDGSWTSGLACSWMIIGTGMFWCLLAGGEEFFQGTTASLPNSIENKSRVSRTSLLKASTIAVSVDLLEVYLFPTSWTSKLLDHVKAGNSLALLIQEQRAQKWAWAQ